MDYLKQVPTSETEIYLMIKKIINADSRETDGFSICHFLASSEPQFPQLENGNDASIIVLLVRVRQETAWYLAQSCSVLVK